MSGVYNRKDHFYRQAKEEGYRSRAAYKLLELNKNYRFFKKGCSVLDLGSFPGGWLQVADELVGEQGVVVGVDLQDIEPFPAGVGAECGRRGPLVYKGDLADPQFLEEFISQVQKAAGAKFDLLLSDMSPKLSGVRFRDVAMAAELVELAFGIAERVLKPGGDFVAKCFPGQEEQELFKRFSRCFKKFQRARLKSSRDTSSEIYFVGSGFMKHQQT